MKAILGTSFDLLLRCNQQRAMFWRWCIDFPALSQATAILGPPTDNYTITLYYYKHTVYFPSLYWSFSLSVTAGRPGEVVLQITSKQAPHTLVWPKSPIPLAHKRHNPPPRFLNTYCSPPFHNLPFLRFTSSSQERRGCYQYIALLFVKIEQGARPSAVLNAYTQHDCDRHSNRSESYESFD